MKELRYLEVKIEPAYQVRPNGVEDRQLSVQIVFGGKEYHSTEVLWNSDAISVLDYCFDRARHHIKSMILEAE